MIIQMNPSENAVSGLADFVVVWITHKQLRLSKPRRIVTELKVTPEIWLVSFAVLA